MSDQYRKDEDQIIQAADAYRRGEFKKIADLAREFKVDYQRLRRRILDTPSRFTPRPQTRKLDSAQDKAAIAWIKYLDEAGRFPTQEMLTNCANSVLCRSHIDPETAPPTVSKMWANRFAKRLSKYKRIKRHPMEPKRIQAEDIGIVQNWYDGLQALIKNHHISPQNIFSAV
ncbi:hypothetical protein VTO42DRAFT_8806 [Malbranchea cinnamomea]